MSVTAIQYGWLWAQIDDEDNDYGYSLTVQVPNVSAYCEIALTSHWSLDDEGFDASAAFITQSVSASGVEEFPKQNITSSPLCFSIFRDRVTSVTFKVEAYLSKAMCRWAIFQWGSGVRIWDAFRRSGTAVEPIARQTAFVYDKKTGAVAHVHQYAPLREGDFRSDAEMQRMALANTSAKLPRAQAGVLHQRGALQLDAGVSYRVDPKTQKLSSKPRPDVQRRTRPKRRKS
jgi:hypothetical protein